MVAKEKWVVGGVAVVAASIWGFLLFTIFSGPEELDTMEGAGSANDGVPEMFEEALDDENELSTTDQNDPSSPELPDDGETGQTAENNGTDSFERVSEEEQSISRPDGVLMRERGILPGDFSDIAPDGIASVDDVLDRLEEENELE